MDDDEYLKDTYTDDTVQNMWTDYDYHVNTGELNDWFPSDTNEEEISPKEK